MALKKDFKFGDDLIELADFNFAFAHPARIVIFNILQSATTVSFEQFARVIPLSQSTISQHLQIFKRVYLIKSQELDDGSVEYALNKECFQHYQANLSALILFSTEE